MADPIDLAGLLDRALETGDDRRLRAALIAHSGLPRPGLDLGLVSALADAVGAVIRRPRVPVARLEELLDGWAAVPEDGATEVAPAVVLPCAAVAAYGEAAVARPDWFDDEIAKLHDAAGDGRRPVREVVASSLRRMLDADRQRTAGALLGWTTDTDPRVVRMARELLD